MLQIVKTADGSNTIYNTEVGEHYHSIHGALQESRHVFVKAGLLYFLNETAGGTKVYATVGRGDLKESTISILEVGFGTGLNFLLSADICTEKGINIDYTGIEAHPLNLDMIIETGHGQYISDEIWQKFINNYECTLFSGIQLTAHCKLQIANCKLLNFQTAKQYDIIYFDAFAAVRQPEMWEEAAIRHTIKFLKPGGVFVTYAITGNLKRALKALGCKVEKAAGAAGKREMLRAVKMIG